MKRDFKSFILEDYFLIPLDRLDIFSIEELRYEFYQLEYCENSLDIPLHYIEYTCLNGEMLEICLKTEALHNIQEDNDWYFQLKNLAKYARAS